MGGDPKAPQPPDEIGEKIVVCLLMGAVLFAAQRMGHYQRDP
jgi:hypothetical protein